MGSGSSGGATSAGGQGGVGGQGGAGGVAGTGGAAGAGGGGGSASGGAGGAAVCPGSGMGGLAPNALWSHLLGHAPNAWASLAVATDGSVVVAGEFSGTVDFGMGPLTSAGGDDIVVVRFAPDGALLQAHRYGGTADDSAGAVAVDAAGNTVFSGSCGGDAIDLGDGQVSCTPFGNFLAKIAPDGTLVWRHGPDSSYAGIASLAIDGAGDIVMVGDCALDCDLGGGPLAGINFDKDIVLARYTASGAHVWSKRFADTNSLQYPWRVALGPSGSIHIGGALGMVGGGNAIDFGGGPLVADGYFPTEWDGFVATFDADGTHLWSKALDAPAGSNVGGLACDANGDLLVGGWFIGTVDFGGGPVAAAGQDVFVARLDAAGNHVWSEDFAGSPAASAWGLALTPAGAIHLGGAFSGAVDFGGGALVAAGAPDAFVVSLDAAGQHLASRRFGDGCAQYVGEVATAPNGNIVVAGLLSGAGTSIDLGNGPLVNPEDDGWFVAGLPP